MTSTYALDAPSPGSPSETRTLLGGKAANLGVMARDLRLPVPPGFVISTDARRAYLDAGWPDGHAMAGDQRYVASPRVDSYHGVWFELHEDLIALAGRRRADEVAAGRA